jgi:CRISPR-associated endonuclease Csn1
MRRLGLDVGTNSVGWCLIEDDKRIIGIGTRIFADGRDPKSGASLAVDRRAARAMRRRRDRYLRRRSTFLDALVEHRLMPADTDEAKLVAELDPYTVRKRALEEMLTPYEIGRALFHLNQRRGFKSNRKAERKQKDSEEGKIAGGAKALDLAMATAGARTLGEFLAGRDTKRVRMDSANQRYDFYPQRRHVEEEFDAIWAAQTSHHPARLTDSAYAALHRILFFQRPLKAQEVGVCSFVHNERRLAKAHPLFQERRLYEEVNQLEITTAGEPSRKLSKDQRDVLIVRLRGVKEASFDSLGKLLKLATGESFNKASETRTQLAGNEVHAALSDKKRFGNSWGFFDIDRQWLIIERLLEEENPDTLQEFLTGQCGLDEEHATATARAPLPEGYGRLGPTASRLILDQLKAEVITYDKAVERVGWHHSDGRTGEILTKLPYYGELLTREIPPGTQDPNDPPEQRWGKITNPTVHIGLRQVEKLVNAIIDVYGRPDHIVVELARALKLNEKQKEEHERRIRKDTAAAQFRSKKLQEESIPDSGANRALLRAWEELNPANPLDRRCPYCARPIGMRQLFSGDVDIDHIIPYSKSLDDSSGNKLVAHRACNREKANRTPFEKWGNDAARWDLISEQAARLHKSKQWRFSPDAMQRVEKDGGFLARQLIDTQYLSRMTAQYLSALYPEKKDGSVYVIPGRMTAMLRRLWGLNSLLPDHNFVENAQSGAEKNRLDHRHHAIDAAVTAATTRSRLMEIATAAGRAEELDLDRLFEGLEPPWQGFREELYEKLSAVTVSHKPDHGRKGKPNPGHDTTSGRLHNDTAYGLTGDVAADGKTPIVVHRVNFSSLKPADIADPLRIPDPVLRNALSAATRGLTGKPFEQALACFSTKHPVFKGIRHVRVREPLNVIPIRDREGKAYKAYKGGANARYNVWALPDGTWRHDVISMFDAHQKAHQDIRPHPAAKKILCLRQNDLVAVERNGAPREIMRVVKFTLNGQITLAGHVEGGALDKRDKDPGDPFKIYSPSVGGLKKMNIRQIRIDPLGRVFDPGPRG